MRILIVEDHPIFRFGVRHLILQKWPDACIVEADNLHDAKIAASDGLWDVVLVDLNLPDATGVESVAQLLRLNLSLRLLVLSLHDEVAYADQLFRLGVKGYLNKEHATNELISAIEKVNGGNFYMSPSLSNHFVQKITKRSADTLHQQLGTQEMRVMLQIASGMRLIAIAEKMHLSPKTVSTYRARIFEKMGFSSNIDLVRYCDQFGLGSEDPR